MTKKPQITHTNRKGRTYFLCESTTRSGKKRYVFASEPKGVPVTGMPEGYEITESVNGVVSLRKAVASPIRPSEVDSVRKALAAHDHLSRYRVDTRKKDVIVYEPIGGDPERIAGALGVPRSALRALEEKAQLTPVLRFRLIDKRSREFCVERMCYLGGIDGWMSLGDADKIEKLARRYVKHLGRESFFELM